MHTPHNHGGGSIEVTAGKLDGFRTAFPSKLNSVVIIAHAAYAKRQLTATDYKQRRRDEKLLEIYY